MTSFQQTIILLYLWIRLSTGFLFTDENCPYKSPCVCSSEFIHCSLKGLKEIPSMINAPVHKFSGMDVSQNNISIIPKAAFNNLTVDRLTIGPNPVKTFNDGAFEGLDASTLIIASIPLLTIIPSSVGQLDHLETLFVYSTSITGLEDSLMQAIGDSLLRLSIGYTKITVWPRSLRFAVKLQELHAGGNHYAIIPDNAFEGFENSLTTLDLDKCGLSVIPKAAFQKLSTLQTLNLDGNRLVTIPDDAFLPNIQHTLLDIYLSSTGLSEIPFAVKNLTRLQSLGPCPNPLKPFTDDAFGGLNNTLTSLFLPGCELLTVPSAIQSLTQLRKLFMSNTGLNRIDDDSFSGLSVLNTLELDRNTLKHISDHAFRGLTSLRELQIAQSGLTSFPKALNDLPTLQSVLLYGNKITSIPNNSTAGLTSVRTIFMSGNPVSVIEPHALDGAHSLNIIDLSHGAMTTVPEAILSAPSFSGIDLRENPVVCNCNLKWILKRPYLEVEGNCQNEQMTIANYIKLNLHSC